MMNEKEQKFLNALRDLFVGAKVEGESGYINLMGVKSRYFEQGVFPQLQKDIDAALQPFPRFREELFDKLYTFFHRYFSESGSIYFRYTPLHERVYEQVYTDDRDVVLFWKTHMLYYVKTDRLFRSMEVEVDGHRFFFDVSTLEHKRANEKRSLIYEFKERRGDGTLVFTVAYSERGRVTKTDEILRAARKVGATGRSPLDEETLEHAFRLFERQSEVDYFINKDARAFLREQFDLWLYQYVFREETPTLWNETRIRQLQVLREITFKIIDFIAQFEDELVKVWNKPRFVLNSHYVITLDRIAAKDAVLLARLLEAPGMTAQLQEWRDLGMVGEDFKAEDVWERDLLGTRLHERYQYLPLDTRYFPDLEADILALFGDPSAGSGQGLDDELDGWLIHSENYQALNTLLPKFRGRVNCVYIDPPFNTAASEIIYSNNYKHSSWLSLVDDRIGRTLGFMADEAILCAAIDDFELPALNTILSINFGEEHHLSTVAIRNNPHGRAMAAGFSQNHEYALFYSKTKQAIVGRLPRDDEKQARYPEHDEFGNFAWMNLRKTGAGSDRKDRPKLYYPIYISRNGTLRIPSLEWSEKQECWIPLSEPKKDETVVYPLDETGRERVWNLGWERAQKEGGKNLEAKNANGEWQVYRKYRPHEEGALPNTWWDDAKYSATESGTRVIKDLFGEREVFSYPKSIFLVEDCLRASNCAKDTLVLDFFAGSGTTAHAVINLNRQDGGRRKYILVEMADYFDTVLLPRIKKVVFSDQWKDGKAQPSSSSPLKRGAGGGISHFLKYFDLEQYEDVLRRAHYQDADLFDNPYEDPYSTYVFLRDTKMLDNAQTGEPVMAIEGERIRVNLNKLYPPSPSSLSQGEAGGGIDLAETLSCLTGKPIRRITRQAVEFEDGETVSLVDVPWELVKPLIWW